MSSDTRLGGARSNGRVDARSVAVSAGAGAAAFVASYLVTFLLWTRTTLPEPESLGEVSNQLFVGVVRDTVPAWKVGGMVLYNAHFVDVVASGPFGSDSVNIIDLAGGGFIAVAVLVPPLFLLVAGFAAVSLGDVTADPSNAVAAGALVLVGYVLLAVVGTVVFSHSGSTELPFFSDEFELAVPLLQTVVVFGVVYPVPFGGLGGLGGYLVADRR